MGGFLQVLGPSARTAGEKWMWGDLKQSMLFYQDLKGQAKGVIPLANARLTVIKTKVGRLWRPQNYIRLVNPDRALLGEYRECVLFFRNGKEMEEWYLALKVATTLHIAKSLTAQASRRNHYSALFRAIGYDWQASSIPTIPRPPALSPVPGETQHSHPHSQPHSPQLSVLSSDDDLKLKGTGGGVSGLNSNIDAKWVNLLAHRIWNFLHNDPGFVGLVKKQISKKLAKLKKPKMMKSLGLKSIEFGNKLPIASNISVRSADPDGNLRLDADIAYHGEAKVELDLVIEVEILGKKIASLPVSIKATIKSIVGRIQLAFSPPPSDLMWMGFYTEPHIDLDFETSFGEKHRLVNIPQLASIAVLKLRQEIVEMMLMPEMDDWPLPHLKVPRGESREKYVNWEYAAGYTPPPKIRTEFDSSSDEDDAEAQELYRYQEAKQFASHAAGPSPTPGGSSSSHPFSSTFASSTEVPLVGLKKPAPAPVATQPQSHPVTKSSSQTTFSSGTFSSQPQQQKPLPSVPASGPPKLPPKPTTPSPSTARKSPPTLPERPLQPTSSPLSDHIASHPPSNSDHGSFPVASFSPVEKKIGEAIPQTATPPTVATHSAAASSSLHADPLADDRQKSDAEVAEERSSASSSPSSTHSDQKAASPLFAPEPGTKTAVQPSGPITKYETLSYASERMQKEAGVNPDELLVKGTSSDVNHTLHIPVDGGSPTLFTKPDEELREDNSNSPVSPLPSSFAHVKTGVKTGEEIEQEFQEEGGPLNKSAAGVLHDAAFDPLLHPSNSPAASPIPIRRTHEPVAGNSRDSSASDLSASPKSDLASIKPEPVRGIVTDIVDVPTSLEPQAEDWTETLPGGSLATKSASNSSIPSVSSNPGLYSPGSLSNLPSNDALVSPSVSGETGSGKLKLSAVPHSSLDASSDKPALPPRNLSTATDPFDDIFAGAQQQTVGFHAALNPPPQLPPRSKKSSNSTSPPDQTSFPSDIYTAKDQPKSWSSSSSSSSPSKPSSNKEKRQSVKESFLSFIDSIKEKMDD